MVEDVTTSGKSIDETYPLITGAANIEVKGLMVSLNRMEVGKGGVKCACDEVIGEVRLPHGEHREHGRSDRVPLQPRGAG